MSVCFFLVALPASGKSTLVNKMLQDSPTLKVVSMDKYIEKKMEELNINYNEVFRNKELMEDCEKAYKKELETILANKEPFIWDQMNIVENGRTKKLARLKSHKYEVICLEFKLSYEVWTQRIKNRNLMNPKKTFSDKFYEDMNGAFEEVKSFEKFDNVFSVLENGDLQKKFTQTLEKKFK